MEFEFSNPVFEWRGPSPFYFVELPASVAAEISAMAKQLSYGWGVIPVAVKIGKTNFTTSLFPKNGGYLLPVKDAVRKPELLAVGSVPKISLALNI